MGWEKKTFDVDHPPIEEGIRPPGGRRQHQRPSPPPGSIANGTAARILVIENHDDFGGHAKRATNSSRRAHHPRLRRQRVAAIAERPLQRRRQTPLKRLGVELKRFETAFDTDFYPGLGLSRAVFFDKASFGVDKLVSGDSTPMVADEVPRDRLNARSWRAFIGDFR